MLSKDRSFSIEFALQMDQLVSAEINYYSRVEKLIDFCRRIVIPNEVIEATRNAFTAFCEALSFSQDELLIYVTRTHSPPSRSIHVIPPPQIKFMENSVVPSIDFLV